MHLSHLTVSIALRTFMNGVDTLFAFSRDLFSLAWMTSSKYRHSRSLYGRLARSNINWENVCESMNFAKNGYTIVALAVDCSSRGPQILSAHLHVPINSIQKLVLSKEITTRVNSKALLRSFSQTTERSTCYTLGRQDSHC